MKTTKPISTISFNSPAYLKQKLDELYRAHIIEFYAFILHKGEPAEMQDDVLKKDHIHVYVIPASNIQTEDLREELKELDPKKPDKPLMCLPFHRTNDFGDWLLYVLHDKLYLMEKDMERAYHYEYEDIVSSDEDELYRLYSGIDKKRLMPYNAMLMAMNSGMSFTQYINTNRIPIKSIGYVQKAWDLIAFEFAKKYGAEKHWSDMAQEEKQIKKELNEELKRKQRKVEDRWKDTADYFNPFEDGV